MFNWQFLISYIFSVSLKFGVCYITGQRGEFRIKQATLGFSQIFWIFFSFFNYKSCVFIIVSSFFDEASSFSRNQWSELVSGTMKNHIIENLFNGGFLNGVILKNEALHTGAFIFLDNDSSLILYTFDHS